jgi:hypothetical protein
VFVRIIRDNVLMGMVIHLNEVTERNFIVSLDPREYAGEKLVCCLGWRQGQPLPRTRDNLIEGVFTNYSDGTAHTYMFEKIAAEFRCSRSFSRGYKRRGTSEGGTSEGALVIVYRH